MSTTNADDSEAGPAVARVRTDDVAGLTVADVMHADVESLPATATVGELRDWFAISASRRLAVIADGRQYAAALAPDDIPAGAAAGRPALELAGDHPTVSPQQPAGSARDLVIATGARRLPVVDAEGRLHGVLAVTTDLRFFACRPAPAAGSRAA